MLDLLHDLIVNAPEIIKAVAAVIGAVAAVIAAVAGALSLRAAQGNKKAITETKAAVTEAKKTVTAAVKENTVLTASQGEAMPERVVKEMNGSLVDAITAANQRISEHAERNERMATLFKEHVANQLKEHEIQDQRRFEELATLVGELKREAKP